MPIAFLRSPRKMRAHGRCRSRGRTERAHRSLENRPERGFPQRPPASSLQEEERTERKPSTSSTHEIPDSPVRIFPVGMTKRRTSNSELRTRTSTWNFDLKLRTWNFDLRTSNLKLRTWNLEPGTSNLELRTWNFQSGTSNLELRTSNFEPRTCHRGSANATT